MASTPSLAYRAGIEQLCKLLRYTRRCHLPPVGSQAQWGPISESIILFPIYSFISSFCYLLTILSFSFSITSTNDTVRVRTVLIQGKVVGRELEALSCE